MLGCSEAQSSDSEGTGLRRSELHIAENSGSVELLQALNLVKCVVLRRRAHQALLRRVVLFARDDSGVDKMVELLKRLGRVRVCERVDLSGRGTVPATGVLGRRAGPHAEKAGRDACDVAASTAATRLLAFLIQTAFHGLRRGPLAP